MNWQVTWRPEKNYIFASQKLEQCLNEAWSQNQNKFMYEIMLNLTWSCVIVFSHLLSNQLNCEMLTHKGDQMRRICAFVRATYVLSSPWKHALSMLCVIWIQEEWHAGATPIVAADISLTDISPQPGNFADKTFRRQAFRRQRKYRKILYYRRSLHRRLHRKTNFFTPTINTNRASVSL